MRRSLIRLSQNMAATDGVQTGLAIPAACPDGMDACRGGRGQRPQSHESDVLTGYFEYYYVM